MGYEDEAMHELMHVVWGSHSRMTRSMERGRHGEMSVMRMLMTHGRRTPSQLAAAMHVTSGRVSTVISSLMKKGWVTRAEDPSDRRRVVVALTDEGRRAARAHVEAMQSDLRWVFERMGERRTREFVDLVSDFLTYMSLLGPDEPRPDERRIREAFARRDEERARLRASPDGGAEPCAADCSPPEA